MSYIVTQESFDSLTSFWNDPKLTLNWNLVFTLPAWLKLWWSEFKPESELYLRAVRRDGAIIGIAPLRLTNNVASFVGSVDVCDYLDFVVVPGEEEAFFSALLDDLQQKGIKELDLSCLRPESIALTKLVDIARGRGHEILVKPEDVSVEMDLPSTFDEYLERLDSKQRHEVKRKMRKLGEAGKVEFKILEDSQSIHGGMDIFLKMFTESRSDKAAFLTSQKESFFRALADTMSQVKLLRMGVLELDSRPAAMILYFDFNGAAYLYNSGYAPELDYLSVGLMSKVLCIQESINQGKSKYDFLKGNEIYKYRLGGKEVTISNCRITFK